MKVKGYEAQNMSLFLARAEEQMNPVKFNQHLLHQQELDPDNFVVGTAKVAGERRAVVLGGHAVCRGSKRLYCASPDRLLELAVKTLENPLVGSVVYDHPVGLEDKKITALNEEGKDSIVVILEEEGYTFCFEAGYQYVLLKTVWDNWTANGDFRVNGQDYVLRIRPSSAVSKN